MPQARRLLPAAPRKLQWHLRRNDHQASIEATHIMRLAGKTAVITGGATGIGLGIATALAGEGCRVAIAGRREDKLREAAEHWTGAPPILTHVVDVADRQSVARLFRWAEETLGKVDILVNAAGINTPKRAMADMAPETWDEVIAINATGAYNCTREVLPGMRQRKDGLIVNVNSISGHRASMLGGVAYSASKFALSALSTAVALEEGRNGIRVTSICPGEVDTPLLRRRPVAVSEEQLSKILQPSDVADAVLMIACLPPRAHVHELIIKPTFQDFA
jgi:NAD(P)-dependent dehydrogenase (short-subunit alcohol dehydrogenase family)